MSEAKARRRSLNVFSLSFLDAMTCGFGAVVLLYMVINAAAGLRTDTLTGQLKAEADRLDREVLEGAPQSGRAQELRQGDRSSGCPRARSVRTAHRDPRGVGDRAGDLR